MAADPGTAPFYYHPGFLDAGEADRLRHELTRTLVWRREHLRLYGREVAVPRLITWCGDRGLNYRYSGADHVCHGWPAVLDALRRRLAAELGVAGNFVLINRYRHGQDYMGWHRDDERGLGRWVVSVSLGATRRFLVRLPGQTGSLGLDLEHGSVLVMDGGLRHSLPRTRRPVAERVNLTFRQVAAGGD